jgi:hypothetical protein
MFGVWKVWKAKVWYVFLLGNVRCLEGLCAGTRIGMERGIILPSYRHVSREVWYGRMFGVRKV